MNYEQFTMNHEPQFLIRSGLRVFVTLWQQKIRLPAVALAKAGVNLGNQWLKIVQSKMVNYAKQTQFSKSQEDCNASINN